MSGLHPKESGKGECVTVLTHHRGCASLLVLVSGVRYCIRGPGTFDRVWRHCWLSHLGERMLLTPSGRGQGCRYTSCSAQVSPYSGVNQPKGPQYYLGWRNLLCQQANPSPSLRRCCCQAMPWNLSGVIRKEKYFAIDIF